MTPRVHHLRRRRRVLRRHGAVLVARGGRRVLLSVLPVLLAVLRVLLRRRLAVLLVLLVLLLLTVLLILLLRRLAVLLVLLGGLAVVPLLLRRGRALRRRRRGLDVFPLLGVIVLLRERRKRQTEGRGVSEVRRPRRDGTGVAERARVRESAGVETRRFDARSTRAGIRRRVAEGVCARERDRDFDALLFADRGSRTDTVGGCVNSGPAKGLCGGNWMNPDPTTREGFCGAKRRGSTGSVQVSKGGRPRT